MWRAARTIGAMGSLSRSQLLVYGAVAVALLLVGARWIRSADQPGSAAGGVSLSSASGSSGSAGGSFGVDAAGRRGRGRPRGRAPWASPASTGCRPGRASTTPCSAPAAPPRGPSVEGINLAARLTDGQQIVMPARAAGPGGVAAGARWRRRRRDGPISLGTATVEELDTIEGIGPVTAQNIIEFRDQHGGISSVDQLDQIDGIGPATMDALRARLQP